MKSPDQYISNQSFQGSSQDDRYNENLNPDVFTIADRDIKKHLLFINNLSESLNYYDLSNQKKGSWGRVISSHGIFAYAYFANNDVRETVSSFNELISELRSVPNDKSLGAVISFLVKLLIDLSHWYEKLEAESSLLEKIPENFKNLLKEAYSDLRKSSDIFSVHIDKTEKIAKSKLPLTETIEISKNSQTSEDIDKMVTLIDHFFNSYVSFRSSLVSIASIEFDSFLKRKNIRPDIALLLAFLKLFQHSQEHLNEFTGRHLEFYFDKVLKFKKNDAVGDRTYLSLVLSKNFADTQVLKGCRFQGGTDKLGRPLVYRSLFEETLNQVKVAEIRSLYIENFKSPDVIQSLVEQPQNVYVSKANGEILAKNNSNVPLFGENQGDLSPDVRTMTKAEIGLVVAAPIFELSSGRRTVKLQFQFEENKGSWLNLDNLDSDQNLADIFDVYYTGPKGWVRIDNIIGARSTENNSLIEKMYILDPSLPAVVGYNEALHQNKLDGKWPMIKLLFANNSYLAPYQLFSNLIIRNIKVSVEVDGMTNNELYSVSTLQKSSKPFPPFGVAPDVGSYLLVGNKELFQKSISTLGVKIDWQNIPSGNNGFIDYYSGYNLGVKNESFKIQISSLIGGNWLPTKQPQELTLFQQQKGIKKLSRESIFNDIDIDKLSLRPSYDLPEKLVYSNSAVTGFLKLELVSPAFGFGQSEYASVLSNTVLENTKNDSQLPFPNKPFAPIAEKVSVNYSAEQTIDLLEDDGASKAQVFHIHPFGSENIYPEASYYSTFLPNIDVQGTCFLGLQDFLPGESFSMLFRFTNSGNGQEAVSNYKNVTNWSYLDKGEWVAFGKKEVLEDSTHSFTKTGVVKLVIPSVPDIEHKIMPSGLFWIKVTSNRVSQTRKLGGLLTQIVQVERDASTSDNEYPGSSLPVGKINKAIDQLPRVAKILQPTASFGGRQNESNTEMLIRASERLRHKQRAHTTWDFERLILQQFPEIQIAKCLSKSILKSLEAYKGKDIVITVIPRITSENVNSATPMAEIGILEEIETYLKSLCPDQVNIVVRNPSYERIKVRCTVVLRKGVEIGSCLKSINQSIKEFLSPWMFDKDGNVNLGVSTSISAVFSFVERLPEVEFVTAFSIEHIVETFPNTISHRYELLDTAKKGGDDDKIVASKPWAVLYTNKEHAISLADNIVYKEPVKTAIGNMMITDDFIVSSVPEAKQSNKTQKTLIRKAKPIESSSSSKAKKKWSFRID